MEEKTFLDKKDIVDYLRHEGFELFCDKTGISWSSAKDIPVDFAKFFHYPAEGIYQVELLLKIYKKTSKYEAIFCYFIDLNNSENIFFIPAFKQWVKNIPKDENSSYDSKRVYAPLINNELSIQHVELGTHLEITLERRPTSIYLKWANSKIL